MTLELSLDPDEPKDFVYPIRQGTDEKMKSHNLKEFYAFAADYLNSPDKRNTIAYRRNAIAQTTTVRIDKLNLIGIVKPDDCTAPMKAVDEFSPKYIDLWKWIQVEFDLECCKVAYDFHQNKLMISTNGTKGSHKSYYDLCNRLGGVDEPAFHNTTTEARTTRRGAHGLWFATEKRGSPHQHGAFVDASREVPFAWLQDRYSSDADCHNNDAEQRLVRAQSRRARLPLLADSNQGPLESRRERAQVHRKS